MQNQLTRPAPTASASAPGEERFRVPAAQREGHALAIARDGLSAAFGREVASLDVTWTHQRVNSRVLDCRVGLADGTSERVMVKIYEPIGAGTKSSAEKLIADDYAITKRLAGQFGSHPRFSVPTPLYCSPQDLVIVTAHMPGRQLQEKLIEQAGWFPRRATLADLERNCRSCGEWLAAFQQATLDGLSGGLKLDTMRDILAMRLDWLVDDPNMPVDADTRGALLAHFDREVGRLGPADLAVSSIHGDFFPGNVLVDGDRVVGLDFAMCRIGSTAADPSYFMFQLETLSYKPKFRRAVITRLQRAFLAGYDPAMRAEGFFTSSPIIRLHFLLHNVMRLAGMRAPRPKVALKRRLHNWGVSIAVTRRLLQIARTH